MPKARKVVPIVGRKTPTPAPLMPLVAPDSAEAEEQRKRSVYVDRIAAEFELFLTHSFELPYTLTHQLPYDNYYVYEAKEGRRLSPAAGRSRRLGIR